MAIFDKLAVARKLNEMVSQKITVEDRPYNFDDMIENEIISDFPKYSHRVRSVITEFSKLADKFFIDVKSNFLELERDNGRKLEQFKAQKSQDLERKLNEFKQNTTRDMESKKREYDTKRQEFERKYNEVNRQFAATNQQLESTKATLLSKTNEYTNLINSIQRTTIDEIWGEV